MARTNDKLSQTLADIQVEINALNGRYTVEKVIGQGSYGIVIRARDTSDHDQLVAIKRVNAEIFDEVILGKRILREVQLLAHFHDQNVIGLRCILLPPSENFSAFYIVMDLMETDLRQVVKTGQSLTMAHVQFFIYQIARALCVIHSAGVVHRDVTPANILVNSNCDLKICDFGLAKEDVDEDTEMTDYVTMRWYRAPELVMEHRHYTTAIDMWGLGLILAELLGSRPLCQGRDRVQQLDRIIDVTGTPSEGELSSLGSQAAQAYLRQRSKRSPIDWHAKFRHAPREAVDLLRQLVTFHPSKRIDAAATLLHPFLKPFVQEADRAIRSPLFSAEDAHLKTTMDVRRALVQFAQEHGGVRGGNAIRTVGLAVAVGGEGRSSENTLLATVDQDERNEKYMEQQKDPHAE